MDPTQLAMNINQLLSSTTCQDIEEFLRDLNASEYESRNMTKDEYVGSLRPPNCEPTPYPGTQGAKKWTVTVILLFFLIFGLIGNLLSATIMFRRARRGLSSYFYLAFLAIVDICILYSGCLLFLFEITFDYHPQVYSSFLCRLSFYVQHLFTYVSAWLIVAVTFERFMVVRYPFQSIRICRMQVAYTITTLIFISFSLYTAHCFFTMDKFNTIVQTDEGYHPNYTVCDLIVHRRLLAFIDLCLYSVLPSILILIFNLLIITTMFHAIKQRHDYLQANSCLPTVNTSQRSKPKTSSTIRTQFFRSRSAESSPAARSSSLINKQRLGHHLFLEQANKQQATQKVLSDSTSATGIRLTCLLLTISFIFVICTLPISIRSLIADYLPSQRSTTRWQITQLCLTLLMYFNHTVTFVLYCLTGRAFRSECRKLLWSLWLLKDIRISCTSSQDSDKYGRYHQQFILVEGNRHNHGQQQQQTPRLFNPPRQGVYL